MVGAELYGNRILNNCLPPIKYSVSGREISIERNIGDIKYTVGKITPGSKRLKEFLIEHNALEDFIEEAFTGRPTGPVREGNIVPIGKWILNSFTWGTRRSMSWGVLHGLWNDRLPINHQRY